MKRVHKYVPRRVGTASTGAHKLQDHIDKRSRPKISLPYGVWSKTVVGYQFTKDFGKEAWRRRDHSGPAALVAGAAVLLRGADLPMRSTWWTHAWQIHLAQLAPRWRWTPAAAGLVVAFHHRYPDVAAEVEKDRLDQYERDRFARYCNISPAPIVLYIKRRPKSFTLVLKPRTGTTTTQIYGMIDDLARGYESPGGVSIDKQRKTALWEVTVWQCDLLATDPAWPSLSALVTPESVPFGINVHGHQILVKMLRRCMMVGGIPDAGKSSFLKSIAVFIASIDAKLRRLHFADPQNGLAFLDLKPLASSYATTGPAIKAQVRELVEIMDKRCEEMEQAGTDLAEVSPKWPWHYLFVDEFADVVDECDAETIEMIHKLMRKGRKALMGVCLCTQSFRADVIPPHLRELCSIKVGFRVARDTNTKMLMDSTAADGIDLTDIPPDEPGRGALDDGHGIVPFRAYRLHGRSTPTIAEAVAGLGERAKQPAQQAVATDAPFVEDGLDLPEDPLSAKDLSKRDQIFLAVTESGAIPIRTEQIMEITGFAKSTIQYWLKQEKEEGKVVPRGLPDGGRGWINPAVEANRGG